MIVVVRHGETDWNHIKRIQGWKDIALNQIGRDQAKTIKEKLKDISFDEVISSPLKRALRTAKIISGRNYKNIKKDERIKERGNGIFEGKIKDEKFESINFNDPNENRYGIENVNSFRSRVFSFCKELEKKYKNKNVLVVTHAGVSIYIRCYFEGEPNNYNDYKLKNCEVITYENGE